MNWFYLDKYLRQITVKKQSITNKKMRVIFVKKIPRAIVFKRSWQRRFDSFQQNVVTVNSFYIKNRKGK